MCMCECMCMFVCECMFVCVSSASGEGRAGQGRVSSGDHVAHAPYAPYCTALRGTVLHVPDFSLQFRRDRSFGVHLYQTFLVQIVFVDMIHVHLVQYDWQTVRECDEECDPGCMWNRRHGVCG